MDSAIISYVFIVFAIIIYLSLFVVVGDMAKARGHNPWPWWLLSLVWSVVGSIAILWLFFPKK